MPELTAEPRRGRLQLVAVPLLLILAGIAALPVDVPIDQWVRGCDIPGIVDDIFVAGESFGNAAGAILIVLTISVLAPDLRRRTPVILCAALCSGLASQAVKVFVSRTRPRDLPPDIASFAETFQWPFQMTLENIRIRSLPSSHTATAVGLAVALAWCFPRGRWLFTGLAALVAVQRVEIRAHYPSDVLFGAALGWCVAHLCLAASQRWTNQTGNADVCSNDNGQQPELAEAA